MVPTDTYAMVKKGSTAEKSLIAAGWICTDIQNNWCHYEPKLMTSMT